MVASVDLNGFYTSQEIKDITSYVHFTCTENVAEVGLAVHEGNLVIELCQEQFIEELASIYVHQQDVQQ